MALIGDLRDLKLPSLIQLNCMERNTAKLSIEHDGRHGYIFFKDGQVVHAEYKPDTGQKAVFRMLGLKSGNFKVESGISTPVQSIRMNWNNLLLEGLQFLDETQDAQPQRFEYLFERLLSINGILAVAILDEQGTVITSEGKFEPRAEVLASFTIYHGQKLADIMDKPIPEFISISADNMKYVLMKYNRIYLALLTEKKLKVDLVLPLLRQAVS